MKTKIILIFLFLPIICIAKPINKITGMILDNIGNPIDSVQVVLVMKPETFYTDNDGIFTFDVSKYKVDSEFDVELNISKKGYFSKKEYFSVRENGNLRKIIELEKIPDFYIEIFDEQVGNGIDSVIVLCNSKEIASSTRIPGQYKILGKDLDENDFKNPLSISISKSKLYEVFTFNHKLEKNIINKHQVILKKLNKIIATSGDWPNWLENRPRGCHIAFGNADQLNKAEENAYEMMFKKNVDVNFVFRLYLNSGHYRYAGPPTSFIGSTPELLKDIKIKKTIQLYTIKLDYFWVIQEVNGVISKIYYLLYFIYEKPEGANMDNVMESLVKDFKEKKEEKFEEVCIAKNTIIFKSKKVKYGYWFE